MGRRGTDRGVGRTCGGGRLALTIAAGRALRVAVDGVLAVLLAPLCAACNSPLEEPLRGAVCARCWASIVPITPPFCRSCGDPLATWRVVCRAESRCVRCRRTRPIVASARAIGSYQSSLRAIVHAFKYGGRHTLARQLAARMRDAGREILERADVVVPVPLHRSRERSRGFNQARELARHLGLPLADCLRRVRRTAAQADLPASRRHANVRGAFVLDQRWRNELKGLTVVLVDDVSTTGATLNACAAALVGGGAREVRALTAARAVARQP